MIKLLIIADDFTGALDTGVKFAEKGIETKIITDLSCNFDAEDINAQVLVIDSETRPLTGENAYRVVYGIAEKAMSAGVEAIYKKTDSALRGNVGSELSAVVDALGGRDIYFVPAFPEVNRVTINGTHYMDGVPIHESAFGRDPFEPVTYSYIPDIIKKQSKKPVICIDKSALASVKEDGGAIVALDAGTDADLSDIAEGLKKAGKTKLLAGCAGMAEHLASMLDLNGGETKGFKKTSSLFVACGSLNPITKKQVERAVENGFRRINLRPEQKLLQGYFKTEEGRGFLNEIHSLVSKNVPVIIDSFDMEGETTLEYGRRHGIPKEDLRFKIAETMGTIVKSLIDLNMDTTFLMTGGDILMGFMKQIGCSTLEPLREVAQGTVLSNLKLDGKNIQVISKSGGFGEQDVFVNILQQISDIDKNR